MAPRPTGHWLGPVGSVLAILAPKGLCPLCVATSGGLLSAVGLGFLAVDKTIRWVLPIFLLLGVLGLVVAARSHRRYFVVALGVAGSLVLYAGWFLKIVPVLYGGMGLLMMASAATFWAKRHPRVPLVQLRLRPRQSEASHA